MKKKEANNSCPEQNENAQERIMNAAREVFLREGYKGARMQDIADIAGINKAMLHYYFRSKEKIFAAVFEDVTKEFFDGISASMVEDMPFEQRLEEYAVKYINFIKANPFVPAFIIHELNDGGEAVKSLFSSKLPPAILKLLTSIDETLRSISPHPVSAKHIMANFISMSIFPIVARPLLMLNLGMTDDEYDVFIEERKELIPKFIMAGIRG